LNALACAAMRFCVEFPSDMMLFLIWIIRIELEAVPP